MRLTEKQKDLALSDFVYFIEGVLGLPLWRWQKRLADDTQAFIDGDVFTTGLFLGPADHGKSSRVVMPLPLWLLARNRDHRIILAGNTDPYIQQISRACMTRIERSDVLREDFGLRPGVKWSVEEWHIERPDVAERAPSLLALGVGAEIQSQRADFIIGDDVLTRRNSRTDSQRSAIASYLETDLGSRIDKTKRMFGKGKTLYYGHRVHADDHYKTMGDRVGGVDAVMTKKYPAIVNEATQEILCPEAHSYDELAAHRSRDLLGFLLMYQQESAQMGTFITQTSMERCRDLGLRFYQSHKQITVGDAGEFKFTWMSLDPAFSNKRWSSHAVWEWWGMRQDGRRQLLWGLRDKVTPESLINITEVQFRLKFPTYFKSEANQAQILLRPLLHRSFPDHTNRFSWLSTHDNDNELQADIMRLFDLYAGETPQKILPFGGTTEQAYVLAKTSEFTSYPDGKRDTIMCDYIGEKGLGHLKEEKRTGHRTARGIMGAVSDKYSKITSASPFWRR